MIQKKRRLLKLILALPPIPPISQRLYETDLDGDAIIQEQLSLLQQQFETISNTLQNIENRLPHFSNEASTKIQKILKILIALPPPPLPILPEPSNWAKKKLRSNFPATGKGGAIVRQQKRKISRKNPYGEMEKSDAVFLQHTGLNYRMFQCVLNLTRDGIERRRAVPIHDHHQLKSNYRNSLSTENRLLLALMMMKNSLKMSVIKLLFGVSDGYISRDFRHVVFCINVFCRHFVQWSGGWNNHPLLGTCGSLDHTHIRIGRTIYDQRRYYRKDKGHAIIAQVICNRYGEIKNFFIGARGASNDQLMVERVVVECCIGFIQRYDVLVHRFRMNLALLPRVAHACALLTNLFLSEHPIRSTVSIAYMDRLMTDYISPSPDIREVPPDSLDDAEEDRE